MFSKLLFILLVLIVADASANALFEGSLNVEDSIGRNKLAFPQATASCPCREKVNSDLVKALRRCSLIIDEGLTGNCQKKRVVSDDISQVQLQSKSCHCNTEVTIVIESALKCCDDALDKVIHVCHKRSQVHEEEEEGAGEFRDNESDGDIETMPDTSSMNKEENEQDSNMIDNEELPEESVNEQNEEYTIAGEEDGNTEEEKEGNEEGEDGEEFEENGGWEEESKEGEGEDEEEREEGEETAPFEKREAEQEDKEDSTNVEENDELVQLEGYTGTLSSCREIKQKYSSSRSGYYKITNKKTKKKIKVYCIMTDFCGSTGGWTRLGYRDVKKEGCPGGFVTYKGGNVIACGRPIKTLSTCRTNNRYYYNFYTCQSLKLPSNGVSYAQVCGKVIGYQYGATQAFYSSHAYHKYNAHIHRAYVDGISITKGPSRTHIWTLAAGYGENYYGHSYGCICPNGAGRANKFVGNHYYCESGTKTYKGLKFYHQDALWDGKQCANTREKSCCKVNPHVEMPWFKRLLPQHTENYLEMRLCGRLRLWGDTTFSHYEFYVK